MENAIRNVVLSFSCPENWENLTDVGSNKYCGKCRHLVVDFTKLSQEEFNLAVRNAPGRLCGRFKSTQLSSRFLKYAAASALAASVVAPTSCNSDESLLPDSHTLPPTEQTVQEPEFELLGVVFTRIPEDYEADTTIVEEPVDEDEYFRAVQSDADVE